MMKDTAYAVKDSGVLGLLALLTTHGILSSDRRALEGSAAAKSRGWLERFNTWLLRQEMRRRDEYLAESTDIVDLELRQRALERGSIGTF
jgi:hypothetical protein